jgi:predicted enzyme related to lactoylglutathione lyase
MRYYILLLSIALIGCYNTDSKKLMNNNMESKSNMNGLRTTIYKVPDIQNAKEWYTRAFGKEPYFDQPYYVGFNIGGFELGLQPEENRIINRTDNVETYWGVNDIQKEYDRLIQIGAAENVKPMNVGGQIMTATIKDPWGNVIGLIYNPDFKIQE